MRKLHDRLAELERAEQDDRDTRSRSDADRERKASETTLANLSRQLVELSDKQLAAMHLPEELLDAVSDTRMIKSDIARNRSLRRVRAELRSENTREIEERLVTLEELGANALNAMVSEPEAASDQAWMDRLLQEGDSALDALVSEFPDAPRREIRQLLRNASKPGKSQRKSLASLRRLINETCH